MFESIANCVTRRGLVILLVWLAVSVVLLRTAPPWERVSRDDDVRFFPRGYPSVVGQALLERGFPQDAASSQVVVISERRDGKLTPADFTYLDRQLVPMLNQAREREPALGIKRIDTHRTPVIGPRLVGSAREGSEAGAGAGTGTGTGQAALTILSLNGTYVAKSTRLAVNRLEELLKTLPPPPSGLNLALTGSAMVGHDMNQASMRSISNTTYTTIALVVVILLVVYRSPVLALIPLLTIALSAVTSLKSIALLTLVPGLKFQVINITHIFVVVVLFGAGTDYCLFLIARYREELIRGRPRPEAVRAAIVQVGGALVASAGTVIVGLGMLWFSSFAKIQYTGPAIALSLAIALAAALTLAPVLLVWLRGAVFWPFAQPHHVTGHDPERESLEQMPLAGFWVKVADLVVRYPLAILALCVLALAPLAVVGARTRPNYSQLADLDSDQPSVRGSRIVRRYFAVGELSPSAILVENPRLNFRSDAGRQAIEALSGRLAALPEVAEVRSVSRPLGKPAAPAGTTNVGFVQRALAQTMRAAVETRYVSTAPLQAADRNHITRIDVVFRSDPFSDAALNALERVHATVKTACAAGQPLEGSPAFGLSGATAMVDDLKKVTTADEHRMYVLVTLGVYAVLVILLRRPGICLYLIATVVLGYLASLGVTELVFRALHNGPEPWVGLDWKVGFFLFVILVAVGEDYNILLMARVIEEERKHGTVEGTRLAVAHTGGIISSCGLIMAGTFGSMLTGSLTTLRELGFALGLGVLLDTFLVRPVLVPAFVVLVERSQARWRVRDQAEVPGAATAAEAEATPSLFAR
jgi:RND superfamily putative drug exporter